MIPSYGVSMLPNMYANNMYQNNDAMYRALNRVGPDTSPSEMAALAKFDKQYALNQAQNSVNYEYTSAWSEQLRRMQKQETEKRMQAIQNGYLFG